MSVDGTHCAHGILSHMGPIVLQWTPLSASRQQTQMDSHEDQWDKAHLHLGSIMTTRNKYTARLTLKLLY